MRLLKKILSEEKGLSQGPEVIIAVAVVVSAFLFYQLFLFSPILAVMAGIFVGLGVLTYPSVTARRRKAKTKRQELAKDKAQKEVQEKELAGQRAVITQKQEEEDFKEKLTIESLRF